MLRAALAIARDNAARHGCPNLELLEGDWLAPVAGRRFDVVVANPPYVATGDPHLGRGDLRFEPVGALDGGPDGLDAIRCIVDRAGDHLRPGGLLALEHGHDQADAVCALLRDRGFTDIEMHPDAAGVPRVALGTRSRE